MNWVGLNPVVRQYIEAASVSVVHFQEAASESRKHRVTTRITVGAFDAAVRADIGGLSYPDAAALRDAWARCRPAAHSLTGELSLKIGDATPDAATLAHHLSTRVTLALIELVRDRLLLLHACAVAHPHSGAVAAFIGPSGRGKTTAAITLGRQFGYVTDETVAVDARRTVFPYPKPLSVVQPGSPIKTQVSPDDLGLLDVKDIRDLRLEAIVLLDRRPEAPAEPELSPVGLVDAINDIVPQISYLSARPRPLLQLANLIAEVGGIRKLSYRESEQLPDLVNTMLDAPAGASRKPTETWSAAHTDSSATTGIRRSAVVDAIDDGEHVIVLNDDMVRVLGGIATHLWRAADGVTIRELTAAIVTQVGAPPEGDATAMVRAAVEELLAAGLLENDPESDGGAR